MKILLNATPARTGGGLQIATSFIRQALVDDSEIDWIYALSPAVVQELRHFSVELPQAAKIFKEPSTNLSARRQLHDFEKQVRPDCVFTLSGPAFVRFRSFHVLGCANGFLTHPSSTAYRGYSLPGRVKALLRNKYRSLWLRQANAWVVQTQTARNGLIRRLGCEASAVVAVSNACDDIYLQQLETRTFPGTSQQVRILCFSAPQAHKNLSSLPAIAAALRQRSPALDFRIVVTLPGQHRILAKILQRARDMNVSQHFENRGPIPVAQGPELYRSCDILLLPSLLETFTTTYPEAMAMGLPIVTTDLDFAHDVCGPAALYHPPFQPDEAAKQICSLLSNQESWERQVRLGRDVLRQLPTQQDRYAQTVSAILSMARARESSPDVIGERSIDGASVA